MTRPSRYSYLTILFLGPSSIALFVSDRAIYYLIEADVNKCALYEFTEPCFCLDPELYYYRKFYQPISILELVFSVLSSCQFCYLTNRGYFVKYGRLGYKLFLQNNT